ncbi:MAG: phosphatidylglycerophosphatase A [Verrucomicrobia bacterium]|nr:phosphatidylglycerophosphatase A [Verrucomicrobiota bacterium]
MAAKSFRWLRFLPDALVLGPATLGPLGRRLPAPGTWGSLAGLLAYAVLFRGAGAGALLAGTAVATVVAALLCGEAEARLGRSDPGCVVLDEVIALPLCFLGWGELVAAHPAWQVLLAGFALFRFYDILKPLGISRLQDLPGGWGVVADDLGAALATAVTLHVANWAWLALR